LACPTPFSARTNGANIKKMGAATGLSRMRFHTDFAHFNIWQDDDKNGIKTIKH
jgi:hypothetical protein